MIRPIIILIGVLLVTVPAIGLLAAVLWALWASIIEDYKNRDWFAFLLGIGIVTAAAGVIMLVTASKL